MTILEWMLSLFKAKKPFPEHPLITELKKKGNPNLPEFKSPPSPPKIIEQPNLKPVNISKNITYIEATRSHTAIRKGIDNSPDLDELESMINLANNFFQPLRKLAGDKPLYVSSFFRNGALNRAVKGSRGSDHMKGEAIDIDQDVYGKLTHITNNELFHLIRNSNLKYWKLIAEYPNGDGKISWVHISYSKDAKKNERKHDYIALRNVHGGAVYANYVGNEYRIS